MNPNKQIERLHKKNKAWINYAKSLLSTANQMHADDIVQESYLKILNELHKDKNKIVNNGYMYNTIRSICFNDQKIKTDPLKFAKNVSQNMEDRKENNKINFEKVSEKVSNLVNTFYWFDKSVFSIYRYEIRSIRKISYETKIGHTQIFNSIKRTKQKLKEKLNSYYYDQTG